MDYVRQYENGAISRDEFIEKRDRSYLGVRRVVQILADEGIALGELDFELADLSGAELSGANFEKGTLAKVTFKKTHLNCKYYYFKCTNLQFVNLNDAMFLNANLSGTDFKYAKLVRASVINSDLTDANFDSADLIRTDFSFSDLTGANFSFATFENTNLTGADLRDTKVTQAQIDKACVNENGDPPKVPEGLNWHGSVCPDKEAE